MPPPAPPSAFDFPPEYHFPPFFTLQTNLSTRHAQLTKWASLVLAYAGHRRIFRLSPFAAATDRAHPAAPLFQNAELGRRLAPADAREVLEFMRRGGRAELVPASGSGAGGGSGGAAAAGEADATGGDAFWIYWRTPEEWAALVEGWIDATGQKGAVLTLYELTRGDSAEGTEFHGMDPDLLVKSLNVLVKRGKAQIFGSEDSQGVKFF